MTQAAEILNELARRGVTARVEGTALHLKPKRALDEDLLARIKAHKAAVLAVLSHRPTTCSASCYEIEPGRWIHRPSDGCNTEPRPQSLISVPQAECRHCDGASECSCPACTLRRTEKAVPCLMCQPEKRQAWLAATRREGGESGKAQFWIQ
jgi:hypothetical protein